MEKFLVISEVSKKQNYIFKTNKLKENIGASNIIEYVTENVPRYVGKKCNLTLGEVSVGGGNSIFLLQTEEEAKKFIKEVTKEVLCKFAGVEFFMTYIGYDEEVDSIIKSIDLLYKKLNDKKSQRSSVFKRNSYGIEERCVSTGLAANGRENKTLLSRESLIKRKWSEGDFLKELKSEKVPYSIETLMSKYTKEGYSFTNEIEKLGIQKGENSYIAIVSLDGNKMGQKIQSMKNKALKQYENLNTKDANNEYINKLNEFSSNIKKYYYESFEYMLDKVIRNYDKLNEQLNLQVDEDGNKIMPIRPIILAGDDVCFICNAQIAMECVNAFITNLNTYTVEEETLNACAGISMMRSSNPFDRGYEIAEVLCKNCKAKIVDTEDASLIDYHICEGEITTSLSEIRDRAHIDKSINLNIKPLYINNEVYNSYKNFKEEYKNIQLISAESKGKVRKLRDVFPRGKEETKIFMNKYQISSKFNGKFGNIQSDFGFSKIDNKDTCLYFDLIELQDMFITLED